MESISLFGALEFQHKMSIVELKPGRQVQHNDMSQSGLTRRRGIYKQYRSTFTFTIHSTFYQLIHNQINNWHKTVQIALVKFAFLGENIFQKKLGLGGCHVVLGIKQL